jgi:hypothetical protein
MMFVRGWSFHIWWLGGDLLLHDMLRHAGRGGILRGNTTGSFSILTQTGQQLGSP